MSLVSFRYRNSKPTNPTPGYFYWVDFQDGNHQIWFAPDEQSRHLILLNNESWVERINNLVSRLTTDEGRISDNESDIAEIQTRLSEIKDEILGEIDLTPYLTEDDLTDYAKKSDIHELTESDYDIIAEKVNEKTLNLTWKEI